MAAETFATWMKREAPSKHFTATELLVKGGDNARAGSPAFGLNTNPPRDLWPNAIPLIRVLDAIRERLGAPITLNSVYRSPAYNKAIGGAEPSPTSQGSLHMQFKAADWTSTSRGPASTIDGPTHWARAALHLRDEGFFKGGVGLYPDQGFVHVDVRGTNVEWIQDKAGRRPMVRTGILAPLSPGAQPSSAPPVRGDAPLMTPHPPEPSPEPMGMGAGATAAVGGLAAGGAAIAGGIDWWAVLIVTALIGAAVFGAFWWFRRKK